MEHRQIKFIDKFKFGRDFIRDGDNLFIYLSKEGTLIRNKK